MISTSALPRPKLPCHREIVATSPDSGCTDGPGQCRHCPDGEAPGPERACLFSLILPGPGFGGRASCHEEPNKFPGDAQEGQRETEGHQRCSAQHGSGSRRQGEGARASGGGGCAACLGAWTAQALKLARSSRPRTLLAVGLWQVRRSSARQEPAHCLHVGRVISQDLTAETKKSQAGSGSMSQQCTIMFSSRSGTRRPCRSGTAAAKWRSRLAPASKSRSRLAALRRQIASLEAELTKHKADNVARTEASPPAQN